MKPQRLFLTAAASVIALTAIAGFIVPASKTFRSPTALRAFYQDYGLSNAPIYGTTVLVGRDLVNLALGTPLGTVRTNEVLALEIACETNQAWLVVHDKTANSNIAVLATTASLDVVGQQDNLANPGPNRARFVGHFLFGPNGGELDGITGGYLTLAGRVLIDPQTGCPEARPVDKDRFDKTLGDREDKNADSDDEALVRRAGIAHYAGVLHINTDGQVVTVLVPRGILSIRRQLIP